MKTSLKNQSYFKQYEIKEIVFRRYSRTMFWDPKANWKGAPQCVPKDWSFYSLSTLSRVASTGFEIALAKPSRGCTL